MKPYTTIMVLAGLLALSSNHTIVGQTSASLSSGFDADRQKRIDDHRKRIQRAIEEKGQRAAANSKARSSSANDSNTTKEQTSSRQDRQQMIKEHNERIKYIIDSSNRRRAQTGNSTATAVANPHTMSLEERQAFIRRLKEQRDRDTSSTMNDGSLTERAKRLRDTNRRIRDIILESEERRAKMDAQTSGSR